MGHANNLGDLGGSAESEGAAVAKRESYEGGGSKGKDGVGGCWDLGMGCSQVETGNHNGAEGQGQSQSRKAREICQLEYFYNEGICGGL